MVNLTQSISPTVQKHSKNNFEEIINIWWWVNNDSFGLIDLLKEHIIKYKGESRDCSAVVFTDLDARDVPRLQPDQSAAAVAVEHARRAAPRALHPTRALRVIQRNVRGEQQAAQRAPLPRSSAVLTRHDWPPSRTRPFTVKVMTTIPRVHRAPETLTSSRKQEEARAVT